MSCVALKGWNNSQAVITRKRAARTWSRPISGYGKHGGFCEGYAGAPSYVTAMQFQRICTKYGKNHDMMARLS